ncbi:methyl-accepting chemotaxis protein [Bosea sp. (in: a-proteobacteria)]|uniref:methyl-accepting chemotaxis protein n=1 Tax=Bosea sp. (in: a-proteobacteria) TaxID=1871050 RepID=UPI003B3A812A
MVNSTNSNLHRRLSFMEMDDKSIGELRSIKPIIMNSLPKALDDFYRQISKFSETSRFFASDAHVAGAKNRQIGHWERISSGQFDDRYVDAVTTVGEVHAKIGLEPRWYIGGYALLLEGIISSVVLAQWPSQAPRRLLLSRAAHADSIAPETVAAQLSALVKAALLDMDFAISVYLEAAEKARLRTEAEALAKERAIIMQTVGEAMSQVAAGNLDYRMPDELPTEYAKLRNDFNAAVSSMEVAMRTVVRTATAIRSSAAEVSQASNDLADRTEEQSTSLQAAAATTEQLAASVKTNAESSRGAESVASQAQNVAERGGKIVQEAVDAMSRIELASQKIAEITSVIDGIAFQTNLLALNAAVEAARAGEAGKGFAVVASEVRTLAQRSSEASKDINQLISDSSHQITQGVDLVRSAGVALAEIVDASRKVAETVMEISSASTEQASGIEDMSNTVATMDSVTQQNAALAEESAAAATALAEQVRLLDQAVGIFQIGQTETEVFTARGPALPEKPVAGKREAKPNPVPVRSKTGTGGWAEF